MQRLGVCSRLAFRLTASVSQGRTFALRAATNPTRDQVIRDLNDVNDFFPEVISTVREFAAPAQMPSEEEWLVKALEYNGTVVRWPGTMTAFNAARDLSADRSPADIRKAKFLAWAIEIIHIYYLLSDDLIDNTTRRWGKPVWGTLPEVGLNAINDAFMMENVVFQILRREFNGLSTYDTLIHRFWNVLMISSIGQNYDGHLDQQTLFDQYGPEMYNTVVRLKTSEITFFTPAIAGMLVTGHAEDPIVYKAAHEISHLLGIILQSEDDFDDVYRDNEEMPCVDIKNGRCNWLIVEAKKRASPHQLQILKVNYGKQDQRNVDAVLSVYNDLKLKEVFLEVNKAHYDEVYAKIEIYAHILPPTVFGYAIETMKHFNRLFRNEVCLGLSKECTRINRQQFQNV